MLACSNSFDFPRSLLLSIFTTSQSAFSLHAVTRGLSCLDVPFVLELPSLAILSTGNSEDYSNRRAPHQILLVDPILDRPRDLDRAAVGGSLSLPSRQR